MISISTLIPDNKCPKCNTLIDKDFIVEGKLREDVKIYQCEDVLKFLFEDDLSYVILYMTHRLEEIQIQLFPDSTQKYFESMSTVKGRNVLKMDIKKLEENPTLDEAKRLAQMYWATESFK
jgi:hypothetical protein